MELMSPDEVELMSLNENIKIAPNSIIPMI